MEHCLAISLCDESPLPLLVFLAAPLLGSQAFHPFFACLLRLLVAIHHLPTPPLLANPMSACLHRLGLLHFPNLMAIRRRLVAIRNFAPFLLFLRCFDLPILATILVLSTQTPAALMKANWKSSNDFSHT